MNYITERAVSQSVGGLQRELDTQKKVRKLLNNLDNTENLWAPKSVIESQAELLNYKKTQILNNSGIRNLILRRNKLSDGFASLLAQTLYSDKYLKKIDVSGNNINEHAFKVIIKTGLLENNSLICFDARINPGFTEKVQRQFALVALKNIEKMRARGVGIKKDWLIPELYSF